MDLALVQDNAEQPNKSRLNQNNLLLLNDQSYLDSNNNASVSSDSIFYIDPSEHFRPEFKSAAEYRIYTVKQVLIKCID